ncbi:alkene reductase [Dyadobacter frigoris]|uniref:Alkene reductase n=1 Tax=Dyadobacter frigoris TaxID=2576211 RepID=A0A4U6D050_9BACT|nr:alkene reductase [Dyadobacter frigoris]TKT90509.1 alkene reductase [Dyadobacter frigoris]GLU51358.1 alkene reductase [Dyadobacter frigoris]
MSKLLAPYNKNGFSLKNHLVMAPMTRSRAIDNIPNDLMAEYYAQRKGAGLIITEGTSPAPEGLGYPRIPGIFLDEQVSGWKKITDAVHQNNTKIFVQFMHTGRIAHVDNLPAGSEVVGVSDLKANGQIFTDKSGMQDHSQPKALTTEEIKALVLSHVKAAENAVKAGFDGIELHGANGYLIEQFLNPNVNNRTDEYGGSLESRSSFVIEIAEKMADAIGKEKVGIRFSPFSNMGDLADYDPNEVHQTYTYLAERLNQIGIAYIHLGVSPKIPRETLDAIRTNFNGTIIICNGLTPESAEQMLVEESFDLVAFGRSFLANPDLDKRIETKANLSEVDFSTAYTPGAKGYTDYPFLSENIIA